VAFSPDGKHLASSCGDHTVKLWDAATGQETRELQTYSGVILCLAFSPDGRRLLCSGCDPTVRMWDTGTGQEILTLQGHKRRVHEVAFSPDGRRVASASGDDTVKVWDATELSSEARTVYEARGLVEWLFGRSLSPDAVAAALRRDQSITEPVREEALTWVEPFERVQVRAEAARALKPLFARLLLRGEVRAALGADPSLSPAARREALALAETYPEDAVMLNKASWQVVRNPGTSAAAYERALRQAQAACRLMPKKTIIATRGG
jgi:hypothetical protein